jgi:hypothetical protein
MIIWSGLGFLVAVIVFGFALACNFAFNAIYGHGYYETHHWTIGVAMFLSAITCWLLGTALRSRKPRIVIDKATGKEMPLDRSRHTLFFIPMHLWAPVLALIGVILCVVEFIK